MCVLCCAFHRVLLEEFVIYVRKVFGVFVIPERQGRFHILLGTQELIWGGILDGCIETIGLMYICIHVLTPRYSNIGELSYFRDSKLNKLENNL